MTAPQPANDRMRTDEHWQLWGERDPYYGVITDERYRRHNLTPDALEAFFESGRLHVEHVLRLCQRNLQRGFAPARALDFGCGVGRVLVGLAEQVSDVVGVDVSPAMLDEARHNCDARGLRNVQLVGSDDTLSQVQGQFDLVHSVIVFQHIEPERGLQLTATLVDRLRPGGIAVLHYTYAKTVHAERFGQPPRDPAEAPPAAAPPSRWRFALRAQPIAPPAPADSSADPEMQMNAYPLNEIFFIAQRSGARRCHVDFTDHGGEWGAILYFQRAPDR